MEWLTGLMNALAIVFVMIATNVFADSIKSVLPTRLQGRQRGGIAVVLAIICVFLVAAMPPVSALGWRELIVAGLVLCASLPWLLRTTPRIKSMKHRAISKIAMNIILPIVLITLAAIAFVVSNPRASTEAVGSSSPKSCVPGVECYEIRILSEQDTDIGKRKSAGPPDDDIRLRSSGKLQALGGTWLAALPGKQPYRLDPQQCRDLPESAWSKEQPTGPKNPAICVRTEARSYAVLVSEARLSDGSEKFLVALKKAQFS